MRSTAVLFLVLAAAPAGALDVDDARHLLARTGLGAPTRAEVEALLPLTREQAVDRVVGSARTSPVTKPPSFIERPWDMPRPGMSEMEKAAFAEERIAEAIELKTWWANEMLVTTSPFTEHLVMFWSNHFTSSVQKVKSPTLMWRQHALIRREAAGDFRALLHAIVDDPAMLVYLDAARSKKDAPNENFARELLELFTLGEGRYAERDIKEAARAFTGTTVKRRTGEATSRVFQRDRGDKTFLGVTGDLDGHDVVEILLAQPRTAEHIVEKLWRDMISPTPDARAVARLAASFRKDWQLKPLLRALLVEEAFWEDANRGVLVKSPVELVVGSARSLELLADEDGEPSPEFVALTVRTLGQDLFDPPNVKGWPGGERWVTTLTLPDRERLAREACGASKLREDQRVPRATLLLPLPTASAGATTLDDIARDPAFQLK